MLDLAILEGVDMLSLVVDWVALRTALRSVGMGRARCLGQIGPQYGKALQSIANTFCVLTRSTEAGGTGFLYHAYGSVEGV